jgi:F-type H+-transporting ATPase subunit a
MGHGFTWIGTLSHLGVPEVILTSLFVSSLLVVFALIANRRFASATASVEPEDGFTVRNVAEAFVEGMHGLAEGVIGHGAEKYVPLLATFFAFILVSNLLGLVPGFVPPTSDFNITFGLGLVSFAAYNYYGARAHGGGYVKQFLGPMLLLAPLMLLVEIFSHAFRPISLGIRLFANIFADHQVVSIFTDLTKVGVPVIFYLLGTFVAVVQAFVFTMLTAIYIALAISHDH